MSLEKLILTDKYDISFYFSDNISAMKKYFENKSLILTPNYSNQKKQETFGKLSEDVSVLFSNQEPNLEYITKLNDEFVLIDNSDDSIENCEGVKGDMVKQFKFKPKSLIFNNTGLDIKVLKKISQELIVNNVEFGLIIYGQLEGMEDNFVLYNSKNKIYSNI
jgi:hypothetical protein